MDSGLGIWFIYDSLNNADYHSNSIKPALKRLNDDKTNVCVMACDMHKQYGSDDCGLFALAYAIAICEEKDPSKLIFHQISMRNHFNEVLQTQQLKQFDYFEIKDATSPNYNEYYISLRDVKINY